MRDDAFASDPLTFDARRSAPWSLVERHLDEAWPFLLDRADGLSFAGSRPRSQLLVDASGRVRELERGRWRDVHEHPVDAVASYVERSAAPVRSVERRRTRTTADGAIAANSARAALEDEPLPRTVGFLAYELGAFIERVPVAGLDPAGLPLAVLSTYDRVDAWDPASLATWTVEFDGAPAAGRDERAVGVAPLEAAGWRPALAPDDAAVTYRRGFRRILDAIRDGEIYQANLARRIEVAFDGGSARAYGRLRCIQPVPCGAYLDLGERQILSNSPECFLRVRQDVIETFPIKGTRPRRAAAAADREARAELVRDPKERSEHLMIVDLERNDLGRVARTGTVEVPELAAVHSFATVHHLVSTVRALLRPDATLADVLRATFPGGSITGAPKIRAMEIIAEAEPQARGIYTGAIGCFNGARTLELNVAIRTAVAGAGRMQYCTGGGIVADSRLEQEWEETEVKARAFLESVRADACGAHAGA